MNQPNTYNYLSKLAKEIMVDEVFQDYDKICEKLVKEKRKKFQ